MAWKSWTFLLDVTTTKLLNKINTLTANKDITFSWIPGHISIHGNDRADKTAQEALQLNPSTGKISYMDLKPKTNTYILRKWQELWSSCTDNQLNLVTQTIGEKSLNRKMSRREVVKARLRIGYTLATFSYLLKVDEAPICITCQEPYTVNYIQAV